MKRQRIRYFTAEEKKKFLTYLESHPAAKRAEFLYKLMFATGLRLHEAVNLNVWDVSGKERLDIIGKGGAGRQKIPFIRLLEINEVMCYYFNEIRRY